jgi:predicted RNA-binding Zn ribbon-like protein
MEEKSMPVTMGREANKGVPESLAIIEAVVNTRYGRARPDEWKSPEQLREWLIQRQLLPQGTPLTQGDQRRMIEVREALRSLLHANNGTSIAAERIEALNHIARHAPLTVHLDREGRAELVPDIEGVDGVIALLLASAFTAMADGSWTRLKACRNERCGTAFYDHSKNRSGAWCTMAKCGSRLKARTYRQRQREQAEEENDLPES